ncbi:hypothetical protein SOVF_190180 [Spinacia oleracea]|nr:hypothetical protein SOVF_190180 [Spinacia oleracea]
MVLVLAAEAAIVFATPSLVAAAIPSTLLLLQKLQLLNIFFIYIGFCFCRTLV